MKQEKEYNGFEIKVDKLSNSSRINVDIRQT